MIRATFSGFSTALSALQANQKRLDITGNNLANMTTPGYTRQQLETSSLNYSGTTSHYMNGSEVGVGFGVQMTKVSQIRNPYLDAQYRSQMTKSSYTDSMQSALDSLANILDESSMDGIRQAFDNVRATLSNMQDSSKVNDPIYESELRSRMQALSNLMNDASRQITDAEKAEFEKLDGTGTSEKGAIQDVNDLLRRIGDLNHDIKRNQIAGQPSLELLDERNSLLDQLSSYVPIEISYYKDSDHSGVITDEYGNPKLDANGNVMDRMYDYDARGNILGKKEWPDDLKVELLYTKDGATERLTLINGTEGKQGGNYGQLSVESGDRTTPTDAAIRFTAAPGTTPAGTVASALKSQLANGSIQASLDMLGKNGSMTPATNDVRGYQHYSEQLDVLAREFASIMNRVNAAGGVADPLLVSKDGTPITAGNIGISDGWMNGTIHIAKGGADANETVLNMLTAMKEAHATLGDKSFADFMNNISTVLANDSSNNANALKTNVTVLNGIQNSRDSISGVSLDEEGSNMMAYISAYNAASRLMTTLDEALNTLINSTGLVGR